MMKYAACACLAAACLIFQPVALASLPDMMGIEEIQKGMHGTAYTVVASDEGIQPFDVDIIGILDNGKGSEKRILAKASGSVVEKAGGALQGMSGSPIYIDGRLVGALSAGVKNMDPFTFLITPISDMLPIWSMPDSKNITTIAQVDFRRIEAEKAKREAEQAAKTKDQKDAAASADKKTSVKDGSAAVDEQPASKADTVAEAGKVIKDAATEPGKQKAALFLSGFGDAGDDFLEKKLADIGVKANDFAAFGAASGTGDVRYDASLQPGSPLGVAVVFGDFTVGATGTVTAVDGNRVLAFGHPFLHRGNVNYFMTDASVVGTIAGPTDGMKLANVGSIIGRVNQDRENGIGGIIGQFPSVVPVHVTVNDDNLGRKENFTAQIAYDEDFVPTLSAGIAYASMAKTADTLGESTAKVHFTVSTDAVAGGKFSRDNMYYNTSDVGQIAVNELAQALGIIVQNTDKESNIMDVKVNISVIPDRKTASLLEAVPDKAEVKPGDTVKFKTTIKPYRKDKETIFVPYTVPSTQAPGPLHLDLRGGGFVPVTNTALLQQAGIDTSAEEDKTRTVASKLADFLKTGRNNEIIVAPSLTAQASGGKVKAHTHQSVSRPAVSVRKVDLLGEAQKKALKEIPGESRFATKYIIDNVIHATLQVKK
jgi:hypothetical protein